jgi:hypothetical protein
MGTPSGSVFQAQLWRETAENERRLGAYVLRRNPKEAEDGDYLCD